MTVLMIYWCRFNDAGGNLLGVEQIDAADDAKAISRARTIFDTGIVNDYEIWDGERLVFLGHRESARSAHR